MFDPFRLNIFMNACTGGVSYLDQLTISSLEVVRFVKAI